MILSAEDLEVGLHNYPDPKPLTTGLPPVSPFTADLLPGSLRAYVVDIAERLQCPPDFPAVGFITVFSGLIGSRLGIRPKAHDDWLVVPNLWGAIVGRPSIMKTPALQEPVKMLQRLGVLARSLHVEKMLAYEAELEFHKVQSAGNRKKAEALIKKSDTDKNSVMEMLRPEQPPAPPKERRYLVNDATVEKLGEILKDNPEGVLLFRDELVGWLKSLDRDGREGDRAFYLESWTGSGSFTYDRIGRGTVHIERLTLAMLGGIQPGPLRDYVSSAMRGGAGNDGLLQRFQLLVWPDIKANWHNVDRWPDTEAKSAAWRIVERIAALDIPHEEGEIPFVRFGLEAQEVFNVWRATLEYRLRNEPMAEVMEAHCGKYRSLVPSLALIFHLIDEQVAVSPVKVEHLNRAIAWAEYLETHARRVYTQTVDPSMAAAIALANRLGELPEVFTARDIYRHGWSELERESTEKGLIVLLDYGQIVRVDVGQEKGRPSQSYRVNPKKNNSGYVGQGAVKTDKNTKKGSFVSSVSDPSGESENIFPGNPDDDIIDFGG